MWDYDELIVVKMYLTINRTFLQYVSVVEKLYRLPVYINLKTIKKSYEIHYYLAFYWQIYNGIMRTLCDKGTIY
jgi:hypothetical protein